MPSHPYPPNFRNRLSSSEDEHENARLLLQVLAKHSVLHDELRKVTEVQIGSAMYGDDRAT